MTLSFDSLIRALVVLALCSVPRSSTAQARSDTAGVASALRRYTLFVSQMAHDSIGALYRPDGVLAAPDRPPIVGPRAVTAFLNTFSAYRVLAYQTRADSVTSKADTVVQVGRWWQRVRIPAGDTVSVNGGFRAEWVRDAGHKWLLRRLGTFPLDAGPWPAGQRE